MSPAPRQKPERSGDTADFQKNVKTFAELIGNRPLQFALCGVVVIAGFIVWAGWNMMVTQIPTWIERDHKANMELAATVSRSDERRQTTNDKLIEAIERGERNHRETIAGFIDALQKSDARRDLAIEKLASVIDRKITPNSFKTATPAKKQPDSAKSDAPKQPSD